MIWRGGRRGGGLAGNSPAGGRIWCDLRELQVAWGGGVGAQQTAMVCTSRRHVHRLPAQFVMALDGRSGRDACAREQWSCGMRRHPTSDGLERVAMRMGMGGGERKHWSSALLDRGGQLVEFYRPAAAGGGQDPGVTRHVSLFCCPFCPPLRRAFEPWPKELTPRKARAPWEPQKQFRRVALRRLQRFSS